MEDITSNLDSQIAEERTRTLVNGIGPASRRARYEARRKTVNGIIIACPEGHEYTEANTLWTRSGARYCLTCRNNRRNHTKARLDTSPANQKHTR